MYAHGGDQKEEWQQEAASDPLHIIARNSALPLSLTGWMMVAI